MLETTLAREMLGETDPGGDVADDGWDTDALTDLANAKRLVRLHGRDIRYCYEWRKWLVWGGQRWTPDGDGEIMRRAKSVVQHLYRMASEAVDEKERDSLATFARKCEHRKRICDMVFLAESEPGVSVSSADLDIDPWALTCRNGTLDLRAGNLRPHQRADCITKMSPVFYDPEAKAPRWLAFLNLIMGDDAEQVEFLQRAVGYSLTGDTSERCLFVLWGSGRNGKSTFLETIRELLDGYAMRTPTQTLVRKRPGGIPNDVARLRGARFVSASESDEGAKLAEATLKDLTGGDTVSARFMKAEFFDFVPVCKIWLGTNHRPTITGTDAAIWYRIRLVPFNVRIPNPRPRREIAEELRAELPGILAWAVQGCLDWLEFGLCPPAQVKEATEAYRVEQDILGAFLKDVCALGSDLTANATDIYKAYRDWAEAAGERPVSQTRFGRVLGERGYESGRSKTTGRKQYRGIGVKTS